MFLNPEKAKSFCKEDVLNQRFKKKLVKGFLEMAEENGNMAGSFHFYTAFKDG
jgi:hypothetical protein